MNWALTLKKHDGDNAMNEFEKTFEKLARTDDPNIIFTNWMEYVIDINLFTLHDRKLDFRGNEEDYFNMFNAWVQIQNDYLKSHPDEYWYDYLGHFYEDIMQSKFKAGNLGQFFTPANVCDVMAQLSMNRPPEYYDGKMINDCAGGSGRLLLASKKHAPNAVFVLQDLDSTAVKMATLNFYIHGVRGAVICKNTLTDEFFEAYRVNNYLGYGIPIPHIEICSSEAEACNLLGIRHDDKVEVSVTDKPEEKVVEKVTFTPKGTGQTTLM